MSLGEFIVKESNSHDTPPAGYSKLYPKENGIWYKKDDAGVEKALETSSSVKRALFTLDYGNNEDNYRSQEVIGTGSRRFTFGVPCDFASLVSLVIIGKVSAAAAGSAKGIDLYSSYASVGEASNTHEESDIATTYDLSSKSGKFIDIDLSGVFTSLSAEDICGIQVDHNSIGGAIDYMLIRLEYISA